MWCYFTNCYQAFFFYDLIVINVLMLVIFKLYFFRWLFIVVLYLAICFSANHFQSPIVMYFGLFTNVHIFYVTIILFTLLYKQSPTWSALTMQILRMFLLCLLENKSLADAHCSRYKIKRKNFPLSTGLCLLFIIHCKCIQTEPR
jgi:hypothetical protein